jgi:hypothetical protein
MTSADLSRAVWRTGTRSGGNGNCVEVAANLPVVVALRDSKDRAGPVLSSVMPTGKPLPCDWAALLLAH